MYIEAYGVTDVLKYNESYGGGRRTWYYLQNKEKKEIEIFKNGKKIKNKMQEIWIKNLHK